MEVQKYSLKELRARKDETQKESADGLNVSPQTYNSWENNPGNIKLTNAYEVATYFGVTIDQLKI